MLTRRALGASTSVTVVQPESVSPISTASRGSMPSSLAYVSAFRAKRRRIDIYLHSVGSLMVNRHRCPTRHAVYTWVAVMGITRRWWCSQTEERRHEYAYGAA